MKSNPLTEGFRQGVIAGMNDNQTPENLTPSQGVTLSAISRAYQTSRQAMHKLKQRHNLDTAAFTNPDQLFLYLLQHSRACRLRTKLADPSERQRITERINSLS